MASTETTETKQEQELKRQQLIAYYASLSWDAIGQFIQFSRDRCFAFTLFYDQLDAKGKPKKHSMERFIHFTCIDELKTYVCQTHPKQMLIDACYFGVDKRKKTFSTKEVANRELTFDMDLSRRPFCPCGEAKVVCPVCWPLAQCGMECVVTVLRQLGFQDVSLMFSGGRGFHVWVRDAGARSLVREAREKVMSMFQPVGSGFFWDMTQRSLANIVDKHVRRNRGFFTKEQLFPVFDAPITVDMNHLLKMPFSPHKDSGRMTVPIANAITFDPMSVPRWADFPSLPQRVRDEWFCALSSTPYVCFERVEWVQRVE